MRVALAGNKERGAECLRAVVAAGHCVTAVIVPADGASAAPLVAAAADLRLDVLRPADVNAATVVEALASGRPDVLVLAGYGPIVGPELRGLGRFGCLNLHGGRLPQYRGSSPMNWALINGEREFGISVFEASERIDAGDVLAERTFPVGLNDTIADLHRVANTAFRELLVDVLERLERGAVERRQQDEREARYFPLRFPEDGLILWDTLTAKQVHDRVRALTRPYPCAFTFYRARRVQLIRSELAATDHRGEPGRVYLCARKGLLVCAADRCLWVREAVFADDSTDAIVAIPRYERFATLAGAAERVLGALR